MRIFPFHFRPIKSKDKIDDLIDYSSSEISEDEKLKRFSKDLIHHWKILNNISKRIMQISEVQKSNNKMEFEKVESEMKDIRNEVGFVIRDLTHVKIIEEKIKEISEKIISNYKSQKLGDGNKTLKLINVQEKEIMTTENKIINLIEKEKHDIYRAIGHLKRVHQYDIRFSHRREWLGRISFSLHEIERVFIQNRAIIQFEAELRKEKDEIKGELKQVH